MYKWVRESKMPAIVKAIVYVIISVTLVYWLGWIVYKVVDMARYVVNWVTKRENFWAIILVSVIICGIYLVREEIKGDKPITQLIEQVKSYGRMLIEYFKAIIESIKGVKIGG